MTGSWPRTAPTLRDGTIALRAHRISDIDEVLAQCQDPEMERWTTIPLPYERVNAEQFVTEVMPLGWQNPLGVKGFAIEALDDGRPRFAGTIDLRPDGPTGLEVGFGLASWARGRGVMTRAVRLALDWAFDAMGVEVALWRAETGNWASRRVAWACGFELHGKVRGLLDHRGERRDAWVGSLRSGESMAPRRPWLSAAEIQGRTTRLRPWKDEDLPRIVEACTDPVTRRWLADLPTPYGTEQAMDYLLSQRSMAAEASGLGWCIADPADDRCVGAIAIFCLNGPGNVAEIGYWTHPDARGRGVMTEALQLATRHGFVPLEDGGLGLPRLVIKVATGNAASVRVVEHGGYRPIGVERRVDPLPDGSTDDLLSYDLLAEELTID